MVRAGAGKKISKKMSKKQKQAKAKLAASESDLFAFMASACSVNDWIVDSGASSRCQSEVFRVVM